MHHRQDELNKFISWFYWIGGLSIVNTLIIHFNGEVSFIVGLGITQFFDGIALGLVQAELVGEWIGYAMIGTNILIGIGFMLFGIAGKKLLKGVYITGMVLYSLDALLFLAFADYLSFGFHVFALFFLVKAVGIINERRAPESRPDDKGDEPVNVSMTEISQ